MKSLGIDTLRLTMCVLVLNLGCVCLRHSGVITLGRLDGLISEATWLPLWSHIAVEATHWQQPIHFMIQANQASNVWTQWAVMLNYLPRLTGQPFSSTDFPLSLCHLRVFALLRLKSRRLRVLSCWARLPGYIQGCHLLIYHLERFTAVWTLLGMNLCYVLVCTQNRLKGMLRFDSKHQHSFVRTILIMQ